MKTQWLTCFIVSIYSWVLFPFHLFSIRFSDSTRQENFFSHFCFFLLRFIPCVLDRITHIFLYRFLYLSAILTAAYFLQFSVFIWPAMRSFSKFNLLWLVRTLWHWRTGGAAGERTAAEYSSTSVPHPSSIFLSVCLCFLSHCVLCWWLKSKWGDRRKVQFWIVCVCIYYCALDRV